MNPYLPPDGSILPLLTDARQTFDGFDRDEITDDGHAAVIVDTVISDLSPDAFSQGAEALGMDNAAREAELRENDVEIAGDSDTDIDAAFDGWEFAADALEEKAEAVADELNVLLPADEWRHFYFAWHESGFYLWFGGDVNDAPDAEDEGEESE